MEGLAFVLQASIILGMALCVVLARRPLRSALALICVQCALAADYIILQAPFVAAMQVLVYAGAIMVLFLFVIMLLNLGDQDDQAGRSFAPGKAAGALAFAAVGTAIGRLVLLRPLSQLPVAGSVRDIGLALLGPHLFGFEAISVLLLAAVTGAIVLSLKRLT